METDERQKMVRKENHQLSISRQCELLKLNRSRLYYKPRENNSNASLINRVEQIMREFPYYGSRKVVGVLRQEGINIGRHRVRKLLKVKNLKAVQPKKKWKGVPKTDHARCQYLLENLVVTAPNQVWCTDISYIRTCYGWTYLVALLDLYSRKILAWRLSNTLEAAPCASLLKETVIRYGKPSILNSDKGSQYTSTCWIEAAESLEIQLSMAGKGRCFDNIHMERFWRSLKQEEVYLNEYFTIQDARNGIGQYIEQYNSRRIHQALGNKTPDSIYNAVNLWTQTTHDSIPLLAQA